MAQETIGQNITFEIYNADGTSFNGLVLHKSTFESVVMSLGDKITGDVYYPTNALVVTMQEYIVYKGVKYSLVNPPTIVREGMASDNSELKGMTKYSFTFYHPMYMLANFPFSDVAVSSDQSRYLSENKTFYWIGNLVDYVAKLNKNLEGTEWCVEIGTTVPSEERTKLSEVLSFDKQTIADALKTGYETWEVPYVIDTIASTDSRYLQGKRFLVHFGLPSEEILVENEEHELVPFVFHFGQGVGLKNNSRTPRNNKIVTRIAGYGSETNVPYGYPQIRWIGDQSWDFTINNDSDDPHSYPIYDGIMNGEPVRLIKHPFTRSTLMPSIYYDTVNKKVNPYATGYNPSIEIKDYYDADNTYENPINPLEPSYEIHEFEKIKPELGQKSITGVAAYSDKDLEAISLASFLNILDGFHTESEFTKEKEEIDKISSTIGTMQSNSGSVNTRSYYCNWSFTKDERYAYVKFDSNSINFEYTVLMVSPSQSVEWDDSMDGDGNYKQSYFKITLPQLDFDLYACAAITQDMKINMRSGACLGCSFHVAVDWEDYKANFYDEDGNFAPQGSQRDFEKYPNSLRGSITLVVQKDIDTFGTLMPNRYQKPAANDEFVILGISLPYTYVVAAEERLDDDMKQYMRDNNVYYFDYPLKFDEHFLATHTGILEQMKPNIVVRFDYAGTTHALYIKQMSVKFWQSPLPQYDITLTDDVEIILNQIGRVTDEVSHLRVLLGQGGGSVDLSALDQRYLSKISDDKAKGLITFIRGLQIGESFVSGLLGEGGIFRRDADGTTYLETDKLYVRMRAYFDTVEVRRYIHSGGNRIASKAGIKCTRVEYIDENGNVTNDADDAVKFRCYFRANDNGVTITNDFEVNDLAFCKETNVDTDSINQHGYWRKVVGVGNTVSDEGELYIDLSASDCQSGSDIPIAQDDIIQLGNTTDTTRQGAIVEYVGGEDAPAYQIYQGINSYSLNNKNYVRFGYDSESGGAQAFIGNPDGSTYLWYHNVTEGGVTHPKLEIKAEVSLSSTFGGKSFEELVVEYAPEGWTEEEITQLIVDETDPMFSDIETALDTIQRQVDGSISTWFYDGEPTLSNLPASEWTTADLKNAHLGDLYYDNLTGYGYRFKYDETSRQWSWVRITDVDVTKALADAAKAQDTADHKRRVFVVQPTPPYDQGDLWVNATYPSGNTETNAAQNKYYNDVLRCNTAKASGTTFAIADWGLASKYTDDGKLNAFLNGYSGTLTAITEQIDKKSETWYQGTDPSTAWTTVDAKEQHVGDLWYDTTNKVQYIYNDNGQSANPRFSWGKTEFDVPQDVYDLIDGKNSIYTVWGAWVVDGVSNLQERDLFIPATDTTQGSVTYKANKVYRCINTNPVAFQEINYTDDTAFNNFFANTYQPFVTQIQSQVDGKAETWYQATDPSAAWNTSALRKAHVGDIWHNTSSETVSGVEAGQDAIWSGSDWKPSTVPQEVYDKIDGKADIFVSKPSTYNANDMWIIESGLASSDMPSGCAVGDIVISSASRNNSYTKSDWKKKDRYTDDSSLIAFIGGYTGTAQELQNQIDKKAETWYQATNPASASGWVAADHVGDLWYCTADISGTSYKAGTTWYYKDNGASASPRYAWVQQDIPDAVFDMIDGKAQIFVSQPSNYHEKDLWILAADTTVNGVACKQGEVLVASADSTTYNQAHWSRKLRYTDDSALNTFLNGYTGTLTGITTLITNAQNAADAAQQSADDASALAATANYLKQAFLDNTGQAQTTDITGGLVLSTIVALRDANKKVWSGISGAYQAQETGTGYKGHGIAAWYGGGMVDGEVSTSSSNAAKSLFRFDGSGYVASKNISWDKNGNVTIQGYSINATTLQMGGSNVVTESVLSNYVTIATAQTITGAKTFGTADGSYIQIGAVRIVYDATNNALKIVGSNGSSAANLYATGSVSALGAGSGGSSGGGDVTWDLLASSSDTRQIALSHLTGALSGYATQSWVLSQIAGSSTGGTVTAVKVGSTSYSPIDGVVSLPAYPTTLDNIVDGSTRKLSDYVTLATAQTITGLKTMTHGLIVSGRAYSGGNDEGIVITPASNGLSGLILGSHNGRRSVFYLRESGAPLWRYFSGDGNFLDITHPAKSGTIALTSDIPTIPTKVSQFTNDSGYITSSGSCAGAGSLKYKPQVSTASELDSSHWTNQLNAYVFRGFNTSILNNNGIIIDGGWDGAEYGFQILIDEDPTYVMGLRQRNTSGWSAWKRIPMGDGTGASGTWGISITGNSATATKLATPRSIWGQAFDGTSYINGTIYLNENTPHYFRDPTSDSWRGGIYWGTSGNESMSFVARGTNTKFLFVNNSDIASWERDTYTTVTPLLSICTNVGVGVLSPEYKLHVNGTFYASGNSSIGGTLGVSGLLTASGGITIPSGQTLTIGDAVLSWDSTNQGIKITKGLYSQTFISALGAGSGGSSGTGDVTWALLASSSDTRQIALSHLTGALSSYATQSWVNSQISASATGGTVTAVKVGTTTYNPSSGVISLPDYAVQASDNNFICHTNEFNFVPNGYDSYIWVNYRTAGETSGAITEYRFANGNGQNYAAVVASQFKKNGGTSSQFLKADGSVDSSIYAVAADYVTLATAQTITGLKTMTHGLIVSGRAYSGGNDEGIVITPASNGLSGLILGSHNGRRSVFYLRESGAPLWRYFSGDGNFLDITHPAKSGTIALTSDIPTIPTKVSQFTNDSGYITSSGSCAGAGSLKYKPQVSTASELDSSHWTNQLNAYVFRGFNTSILNNNGIIIDGGWDGAEYGFQILIDEDPTYVMGLRQRNTSGWSAWKRIPMGDGTGASGTWGISITGNSATATKLATPRSIWGQAFDGTSYINGTIYLNENTPHYFRDPTSDSWRGGIYWGTSGNESMSFVARGTNTKFLFVNNSDIASWERDTYTTVTPLLSICTNVGVGVLSPEYKLHVNGTFYASGNSSIGGTLGVGTTSPSYKLDVYGTSRSKYMVFYNNAYNGNAGYVGAGSSSSNEIILEAYSGNALSLWSNGTRTVYINTSNNVGIGTDSPSQKLHVSGNIYATGAVTCLSDIRKKMIVRPTEITVEQIAKMPSIVYRWKDNGDDYDEHVGSIAQDWQKTLPQVVLTAKDEKKTLSMQYGVASLVSVITVARRVVNHEKRIKELEETCERLRTELSRYKAS